MKNHVERAAEENGIIVTRDDDFLSIADKRPEHPGIFFITGYSSPAGIANAIDSITREAKT